MERGEAVVVAGDCEVVPRVSFVALRALWPCFSLGALYALDSLGALSACFSLWALISRISLRSLWACVSFGDCDVEDCGGGGAAVYDCGLRAFVACGDCADCDCRGCSGWALGACVAFCSEEAPYVVFGHRFVGGGGFLAYVEPPGAVVFYRVVILVLYRTVVVSFEDYSPASYVDFRRVVDI